MFTKIKDAHLVPMSGKRPTQLISLQHQWEKKRNNIFQIYYVYMFQISVSVSAKYWCINQYLVEKEAEIWNISTTNEIV